MNLSRAWIIAGSLMCICTQASAQLGQSAWNNSGGNNQPPGFQQPIQSMNGSAGMPPNASMPVYAGTVSMQGAGNMPMQSAPQAILPAGSDDSLSRVVFGIPGNGANSQTNAALTQQYTNALTTMAAMNSMGNMSGGMGGSNGTYTYGPGTTYYPGAIRTVPAGSGLISGLLGSLLGPMGALGRIGGTLVTSGPYSGSYGAVRAAMNAAAMSNLRQAQTQAAAQQASAMRQLR